jgi:hypothetical protein
MPRAALRRAGFDINRYPPVNRRQELARKIAHQTGNIVTSGLFAGLILPNEISWGDGDQASKLLGLYEKELEPALETVVQSKPDAVIVVGCPEGFYALRLARLILNAKLFAYDTDQRAQQIARSDEN